jgi:murein tripeptide amidase MpaA
MRLSVFLLGLFATSAFSLVIPQRKSYTGHSVWKVHVGTHDHAKAIKNLEISHGLKLDFWRDVKRVPGSADIRVSPNDKPTLKKFLDSQGIPFEVKIEDVDSLIQEELSRLSKRKVFQAGDHPSKITLDQYHDYSEIMAYLDATVSQYPTTVSKFSVGNSYEKRAQTGVKIGNPTGSNKPAVYVEGCIHAREWLATATMLYIIDQLTTNATSYKSLLDAIDVYVLPVTNPDGYVYTWTTDRMWRKTRSGPRRNCYGVDPNRNFNFKWMVAGASTDPCSEEYAGPSPASEIEVQNLQNFWGANNKTIQSVFDIHTYSEDFMYPYGYAEGAYPPDVTKIKALAAQATLAVNSAHGEHFQYGAIIDIVYPASGSTIDYTRGVNNIDYSYAMELRPDGNAVNGFVLPEDQILDGASEAWAGISVVFQRVASGQ